MDLMEAIMTRRSIRKYSNAPVEEEKVEKLLRSAMAAPSAGNQQPWHFVVVRSSGTLKDLAATSPYAQALSGAPLAIVVCGDTAGEKHKGYWVQDCAAAAENILLTAHALGLGAVWLGFYPREERVSGAQKVLGLPDYVVPLCILPVGYPDGKKEPADRYDGLKIHWEKWGKEL